MADQQIVVCCCFLGSFGVGVISKVLFAIYILDLSVKHNTRVYLLKNTRTRRHSHVIISFGGQTTINKPSLEFWREVTVTSDLENGQVAAHLAPVSIRLNRYEAI